jgi:tetratricopeptide (TPR) repeat protein
MHLASFGLDAVVALQHGRPGEASRALAAARERVPAAAAVPPSLWTAATLGAQSPGEAVRHNAVRLLDTLLGVTRAPPPRGYASIAPALEAAGRKDMAVGAWRRAAAMKEPQASERLGRALLQHGWALAGRGEREAAIEALQEARTHLLREKPA